MMTLQFNEAKTTQAAALLLRLRGGRMSYMKLIKLLYLLDRGALLRWGRAVTGDQYVSMPHGPVLSQTLDLINEGKRPEEESAWAAHISPPEAYEVELLSDAGDEELSDAEKALISEVFAKYGNLTRWQLRDLVHALPEWQDPEGGAIPISYRDILKAGGKSDLEIASIEEDVENLALFETILGPK
jgi:uncharacterized phage-associated protein